MSTKSVSLVDDKSELFSQLSVTNERQLSEAHTLLSEELEFSDDRECDERHANRSPADHQTVGRKVTAVKRPKAVASEAPNEMRKNRCELSDCRLKSKPTKVFAKNSLPNSRSKTKTKSKTKKMKYKKKKTALTCDWPDCGHVLSSVGHLKRHQLTHSSSQSPPTRISNQSFKHEVDGEVDDGGPDREPRSPSSEKRAKFVCVEDGCGKSFAYRCLLESHRNRAHLRYKPYECPRSDCSKNFVTSQELKVHIQRSHASETLYKCETCAKVFVTSGELYLHEKFDH